MAAPATLKRDARLLFSTRFLRLFAYGGLATVLLFHLAAAGLGERASGALLTAALLGDTAISLGLTSVADRAGRRRTLATGALLMTAAAAAFAFTRNPWLLFAAAIVGVISPSGSEVGPFLAIEQAALAQTAAAARRTSLLAWYNLTGSVGTALGSLVAGGAVKWLGARGWSAPDAYRAVVLAYGAAGLLLAALSLALSPAVEIDHPSHAAGLGPSRRTVFKLAALFSLDAFGGGFVVQAIVAWWFAKRHGMHEATLGAIFFGANLFAGASALLAARLAARFGLINTMVFTHIPSNVLLILVPFMPTREAAVAVLLARFSISQMDVPTRQSYTLSVVAPEERSAAQGVTGVARTLGAALAPVLAGPLLARPGWAGAPFVIAGTIKIAYDLMLLKAFRRVPERPEAGAPPAPAARE